MAVRGYVLEPDRVGLQEGADVALFLDALPAARLRGRIERISGAPEPKAEWGEGRYFTVDIQFDSGAHAAELRPGMSVRVEAKVDSLAGATP
jgi:hypothetical protein